MNEIVFRKTSNIFINAGIVGFYIYAHKYLDRNPSQFPNIKVGELQDDELKVSGDGCLSFLEDVYYFMGKQVYDTATDKQIAENGNFYFNTEKDDFVRFAKMNTYGLTHLLTNNAQGITRYESNTIKEIKLKKESPILFEKIVNFRKENNLKPLKKIFFNEPYTKLTRLESPSEKHLKGKKYTCSLTNEGMDKKMGSVNISPFISGLTTFNSHTATDDLSLSWKAIFLCRFSPVICLYTYQNGYDSIFCNFLNSDSLKGIHFFYNKYKTVFRQIEELRKKFFRNNFRLYQFAQIKKGDDEAKERNDYAWESEYAFMLLFTFYQEFLKNSETKLKNDFPVFDLSALFGQKNYALSLVSFRADKFSSTMRPVAYEEYNKVKFMMSFFHRLQEQKINLRDFLNSLKLSTEKIRTLDDFNRKFSLERWDRAKILNKILSAHTILPELSSHFYQCYSLLATGNSVGYKDYKTLTDFLLLYESIISTRNNMKPHNQLAAIKLGKSIGSRIVNYDSGKIEKENAKSGRKYIIGLHKARTMEQFTESLIRIQQRFEVYINDDVLADIDEQNFIMIRQFLVLGALNVINYVLSKKSKSNETK